MWKLFQASPSKNLDTVKSPSPLAPPPLRFESLEGGSHSPLADQPHLPAERGEGLVHTMQYYS